MISTHISKSDGFILLDTLIALLILSLTLTYSYSFLIRTFKFQDKVESRMESLLNQSMEYDREVRKVIK